MHPRVVLAAVLAFVVVGGTVAVSAALASDSAPRARVLAERMADPATARSSTNREPVPEPDPAPVLNTSGTVSVDHEGFLAWAALDRTTGGSISSPNATETSSTESMIKVWLVADYLRRVTGRDEQPSKRLLREASRAIRDSDNGAAEQLYAAGGRNDVVRRMIKICDLADTRIPDGGSGWWSRTQMSPEDAVRLGECLADGTAAGPEWTDWVLAEMRAVRGTTAAEDQRPEQGFEGGRWGIIDGLPEELAGTVAIKNGWTRIGRTGSWHVNCLAVASQWVMAVMMRYPAEHSLDYGAQRCASVAHQLVGPPAEPAGASRTGPEAR